MIETCAFGRLSVDGRIYDADLMILPDGHIIENWRREKGHSLSTADVQPLVSAQPDIIVAGTGMYGLMRPRREVAAMMSQYGIQWIALKTKSATRKFNQLKKAGERVAACFHLTC